MRNWYNLLARYASLIERQQHSFNIVKRIYNTQKLNLKLNQRAHEMKTVQRIRDATAYHSR